MFCFSARRNAGSLLVKHCADRNLYCEAVPLKIFNVLVANRTINPCVFKSLPTLEACKVSWYAVSQQRLFLSIIHSAVVLSKCLIANAAQSD